jgi:drug/metabolite transporter (DMT)-like permease
MESTAFLLILFSGIMHALWNLLVKQSRHKTVFIWWMFITSGSLFSAVILALPAPFPHPSVHIIMLAIAGAVCFVLYHLFTGRSYRSGDLSLTYPLSQTAMVYVPIWGMIILGERLSFIGAGGILLVIVGACTVQMQKFAPAELIRPFRNLGNQSVQAALAAGFVYSLGAIIDKTGVQHYSPLYFTHLLVIAMLIMMTLNLMRPRYRSQIIDEWRESRRLILISGPVMMASFVAFRYGLSMAPMSYAVPVRQFSILVGVLIGVLFLGESCGKPRFAGAALILLGIFLIRMS